MMPREISSLSSKAKWTFGRRCLDHWHDGGRSARSLDARVARFDSIGIAIYRCKAELRYDPLDPRFGSCIPAISMPRAIDSTSPLPDGEQRLKG